MNNSEKSIDQSKMESRPNRVQTPIIEYVNLLLDRAIQAQASDLHLEPFEKECSVRYRIDGVLHKMKPLPSSLAAPMISRMKLLADLDITEQRLPQDGRFQRSSKEGSVDFRISTLPTPWGESLALRLLDRRSIFSSLKALELHTSMHQDIRTLLTQPHGLFIVTGPTGSGKTTTLYACLHELNARGLKLLSAEDPVEYQVEGVMQITVNEEIGLSFQRLLRSFLRHDPDCLMVGETRDRVTAQMALQASLTGHLVLTTLHTNDAAGAIVRLIDMGLDPLMISTTLRGVLAQRLIRKICTACRVPYQPEATLLAALELDSKEFENHIWYRGIGCPHCHHSGYRGRRAFFELLPMHDELRLLINQCASHHQLQKKAVELGMKTLREDARRLVMEGITTVEEVLKAVG
jgi:type IV pilus assembly protein PilB